MQQVFRVLWVVWCIEASTPERGAAALAELLAFRRANERRWIGNFNHNAWVEDLSWKLSSETKQAPDLYP